MNADYHYFRLIVALVLLGALPAQAQKFWLLTYEFPGGPKTGIAKIGDTCLIVGLTDGVLRSFNEGNKWDRVLDADQVFTVFATDNGVVYAGGAGKIYVSENFGESWDSVSLNHNYPVTQFTVTPDGAAYAITGTTDINGYAGAGVYYSPDHGTHWLPRNNGLGNYLSCNRIAADRNGRLYLTVADEFADGGGGLFISENNGLAWEHIDLTFDGDGVINDEVSVQYGWGLNVSPQDTVYLSVDAVAVNVGVRLNLYKHIGEVRQNGHWRRMAVNKNSSSWWSDRLLNGIHFAKNGDFYSSISGSLNVGGTYFSKDGGMNWNQQKQGLGLDVFGEFNAQSFVEKSSGKVFMVQYFDERIYWADTSRVTSVGEPLPVKAVQYAVQPNPAGANETVKLVFKDTWGNKSVAIMDTNGKIVSGYDTQEPELEFDPLLLPGIYLLAIREEESMGYAKLIVH